MARALSWSTPRILRASRLGLFALDALLLVMIVTGAGEHRAAVRTVGKDAAPSIIAAEGIRTSIAGMDAEIANELLIPPESGATTLSDFDADRDDAVMAVLAADRNITYGDKEAGPIGSLQNGLAVYQDLVQRARDLHGANGPDTLDTLHQAETLVDRSLLPAADDLDRVNFEALDTAYRRESTASTSTRFLVAVAGLLLLGLLVWLQRFLSQRTRRTLNPFLLLATLLTLGITVHAWRAMGEEQAQLRIAREDSFASVHALLRARAVAYEANSAESRYLLDPERAAAEQQAFQTDAALLADVPPGQAGPLIDAAAHGEGVVGFRGYLADELNNITFPGEREAAVNAFAAWEQYVQVDQRIRRFEQSGHHQDAVDLDVGTSPGQSDWAFKRFNHALGATLDINRQMFDISVDRAFAALKGLEEKAAVVALLVAVLVILGITPRLREYA